MSEQAIGLFSPCVGEDDIAIIDFGYTIFSDRFVCPYDSFLDKIIYQVYQPFFCLLLCGTYGERERE